MPMKKKRHHVAVGTTRKGWKKVKAGHGRHTWRKVKK